MDSERTTSGTAEAWAPAPEDGADRRLELTRERRQWVRFILPDIVTRMSWRSGGQVVSQMAHVVNVSAEMAVLQMDDAPPADEPVTVHFEHGDAAARAVPSRVLAVERTDSGKALVRVAFESAEQTRTLLFHRRERRAWRRARPMQRRVVLSWEEERRLVSIHGELEDISGGGAAVRAPAVPPAGVAVWMSIRSRTDGSCGAECRLVGSAPEAKGLHLARLAFVDLCPFQVYAVAMGLVE